MNAKFHWHYISVWIIVKLDLEIRDYTITSANNKDSLFATSQLFKTSLLE